MRDDLDAAVAHVGNGDGVAEVAGAALDLDALLEESGERGRVEDAVLGRLLGVDDVLYRDALAAVVNPNDAGPSVSAHTFWVVFCPFFEPFWAVFYIAMPISIRYLKPTARCRTASEGVGGQQSETRTVA